MMNNSEPKNHFGMQKNQINKFWSSGLICHLEHLPNINIYKAVILKGNNLYIFEKRSLWVD